jgi:nucleotide-binding universal stress UspA family protein
MEQDVIVAGTDGSGESLYAVEWAAREAAARGAELQIIAVPTLPPRTAWQRTTGHTPEAVAAAVTSSYKKALAAAAGRAAEIEPGLAIGTALRSGSPVQVLCEAGKQASMLVVGSRGAGGFAALVLGSVSRYVATRAECPVVVVRQGTMAVHREVVVGVRDLDQPSAIGFAFEEAALRRARLHAVHAWQSFLPEMRLTGTERPGAEAGEVTSEAAQWLAALMSFWREKYPEVDVIEDVMHAQPGRILAGLSARADLIVLGRNTADDSPHPGTNAVTHAVLHHALGPVAIIAE